MVETSRFIFSGQLQADAFIEFARHRAVRLDLSLDVGTVSNDAITLTVCGNGDLLDAFELACSLGPQECVVLDVIRKTDNADERSAEKRDDDS